MTNRELGTKLRTIRVERELSQRRAAELTDALTHQALSQIERGEHAPSLATLLALSRTLGFVATIEGGEIRLERPGRTTCEA